MANVNPVQVQKYLSDLDYPASKEDIVSTAKAEGADDMVVSTLNKLRNGNYQTPADINQALGDLE